MYDIPDIGQIYSIYITELKDGAYGIGSESLDCALFTEEDIPWDKLAFEAVRRTLKSYFADRQHYDSYDRSHPNIRLDILYKMPQMDVTIGVGQRTGY